MYRSSVRKMALNAEDAILAAAAVYILLSRPRVKSTRRFWVRPSLTARKRYSGTDLLGDLAKDDVDPLTGEIRCDGSFKNFIRMTQTPKKCFNNMLSSVDKSTHVIKQCFKTSFDLYRQLMDNIKHVIKQEKCYKTLRYITFFFFVFLTSCITLLYNMFCYIVWTHL
jgi:hypothetical protein